MGVTYLAVAAQSPLAAEASRKCRMWPLYPDLCEDLQRPKWPKPIWPPWRKNGVLTGFYAMHPDYRRTHPVWVANFVLMHYGTGAVMAVPAHDQRDYEFAKNISLPVQAGDLPAGQR
jgi:leucyl-tRNA synthetase